MVTEAEFERANKRMDALLDRYPHATAAQFDAARNRLVISLSTGAELALEPKKVQDLTHAKPADLKRIEISSTGLNLHFPALDADLYLPGLIDGALGSRKWMAAQIGAKGGRAVSAKKTQAARSNGKLGGRPKKVTAEA